MDPFSHKRVADPVHGSIGLSKLEVQIIDTAVFRRLANVRQLGLAYYVYPGADYSRLSHSLGVCHTTGRIIDALRANSGIDVSDEEKALYRLAGLLHDVGHYPYSHAMEHAIANYFSERLTQPKGDSEKSDLEPSRWFEHERVGEEILKSDEELCKILERVQIKPEEIYSIFNRRKPSRFSNLVSSDLDADRIDYLLRTAHHTGLPYGSVDLDYLLSQIRVDSDEKICITSKALRTAEHFLLCRYFDYQQVSYHKTVAAIELVLKDVLAQLLQNGTLRIDGSSESVSESIKDEKWSSFDDVEVLSKIREVAASSNDDITKQKANAIILRTPPKLVADYEFFGGPDKRALIKSFRKTLKDKKQSWASHFDIDEKLWYIWDTQTTLTKMGRHVPLSEAKQVLDDDSDKIEQAIRVLDSDSSTSKPIMENERSLMSVLSNSCLYGLRLYVLLSNEKQHLRSKIQERVKADMAEYAD